MVIILDVNGVYFFFVSFFCLHLQEFKILQEKLGHESVPVVLFVCLADVNQVIWPIKEKNNPN